MPGTEQTGPTPPLSDEERARMRAQLAEQRKVRAELVRIIGEAKAKIDAIDRQSRVHLALLCADAVVTATTLRTSSGRGQQ